MHTKMTNLRFKSERFYCLISKILNHFQLVRFPQLEICPRLTDYTKLSDMKYEKPVILPVLTNRFSEQDLEYSIVQEKCVAYSKPLTKTSSILDGQKVV